MKGFITYTIKRGDTLQAISAIYKIPMWQDIAIINKLKYPFIDDSVDYVSKDEQLRYIGDSILIPSDYEKLPNTINNDELQKMAYGSDLDIIFNKIDDMEILNLENNGELKPNDDGDLLIVEGINNLKQSILLKLITPVGSLPLHPEYGSDISLLIGSPRTYQHLIKIKLATLRAIKNDFRIKDVKDMNVYFSDGGGVKVDCIIEPIDPFSSFRFVHEFLLL